MNTRFPIATALMAPALLLSASPGAASAAVFLRGSAGPALLNEEGHAPPLCCYEREDWVAPGARAGVSAGWTFGELRLGLDLGLSLYQVVDQPGLELRLLSPDAAGTVGGRLRWPALTLDFAVGAGWRYFSGTARGPRGYGRDVSTHAPDLRAGVGLHVPTAAGHSVGVELTVSKVMIEQTVAGLSFVIGWEGLANLGHGRAAQVRAVAGGGHPGGEGREPFAGAGHDLGLPGVPPSDVHGRGANPLPPLRRAAAVR